MNATTKAPVVMITGALTGIGRATAQAFARDDARTVLSDCRERRNYTHLLNPTLASFEQRYFKLRMPAGLVR